MALRDEFDDIDMTEFAELSSRVRADRERRKRDFTTVNDPFTVIGGSAPAEHSRPSIGAERWLPHRPRWCCRHELRRHAWPRQFQLL